jgi:hypothetical protein
MKRSNWKRTWLHPEHFRKHSPINLYVIKKREDILCTGVKIFLGRIDPRFGKNDSYLSETNCSKTLYDAFIAESKVNRKRFPYIKPLTDLEVMQRIIDDKTTTKATRAMAIKAKKAILKRGKQ